MAQKNYNTPAPSHSWNTLLDPSTTPSPIHDQPTHRHRAAPSKLKKFLALDAPSIGPAPFIEPTTHGPVSSAIISWLESINDKAVPAPLDWTHGHQSRDAYWRSPEGQEALAARDRRAMRIARIGWAVITPLIKLEAFTAGAALIGKDAAKDHTLALVDRVRIDLPAAIKNEAATWWSYARDDLNEMTGGRFERKVGQPTIRQKLGNFATRATMRGMPYAGAVNNYASIAAYGGQAQTLLPH